MTCACNTSIVTGPVIRLVNCIELTRAFGGELEMFISEQPVKASAKSARKIQAAVLVGGTKN